MKQWPVIRIVCTFIFTDISIVLCEFLYQIICKIIRWEYPSGSDRRLIEHTDSITCFFHFIIFQRWINHKSVMFLSFQQRFFASCLVVIKAYFHVICISVKTFFVKLLILLSFFDLLIEGKYYNIIWIIFLWWMLVVQFYVFWHNRPWII